MNYLPPQAEVRIVRENEATTTPRRAYAHFAGGNAQLVRYAEAAERPLGVLGLYDAVNETVYSFPNLSPGALIDPGYTKLYLQNAVLAYLEIDPNADEITAASTRPNALASETFNFRYQPITNYSRNSLLEDRDVQIGDYVRISHNGYDFESHVIGFDNDMEDSDYDSPDAVSTNPDTQVLPSGTANQIGGPQNCIVISDVSTASYSGWATGRINETYTITVTRSSTNGVLTTGRLRITSADGQLDLQNVVPNGTAGATAIGSTGANFTFGLDVGGCSVSAANSGISSNDVIQGQVFVVTTGQAYDSPDLQVSGTYTGDIDDIYTIEVIEGALFENGPKIRVTSASGRDGSGPTTVLAEGAYYALGTKGLTVAFDNTTGLLKGTAWTVNVEAAKPGPIRTLLLAHNLPQNWINTGDPLPVVLGIRKDVLELPQNLSVIGGGSLPLWSQDSDDATITVQAGLQAYEPSWTIAGGQALLPVYGDVISLNYNKLYVQYRGWLPTLCGEVFEIDGQNFASIPGPNHPDNPLKYAVSKGLANSQGVAVYVSAVCNPNDLDSWSEMLDVLSQDDQVYGLVPLSEDAAVWSLYIAHVEAMSTPDLNRRRVVRFGIADTKYSQIVSAANSTNGSPILATIVDNPVVSGTQNTYLQVADNNSDFVTRGVLPGDEIRFRYSVDANGIETYETAIVQQVINQSTLLLRQPLATPLFAPTRIEIWRLMIGTNKANLIAARTPSTSERVSYIYGGEVRAEGRAVPNYFLASAVSALASGVPAQQGLTRSPISGFERVSIGYELNRTALNTMAEAGVWLVVQNRQTTVISSRHAITSAPYALLSSREESLVRNPDMVAYAFFDVIDAFVGVTNLVQSNLDFLRVRLSAVSDSLRNNLFNDTIGAQIVDYQLLRLERDPLQLDALIVEMDVQYPVPVNNPRLTMRVRTLALTDETPTV